MGSEPLTVHDRQSSATRVVPPELEKHRPDARRDGGDKRIANQHPKGKLTARERIDDVIMPHGRCCRIVESLKNLKGKQLTSPWKKHDHIAL